MSGRRKVLLFGEAVTLAHVTRIMVLADLLDPQLFEIEVAFDGRYDSVLGPISWPRHPLYTISCETFRRASKERKFPYSVEELKACVDADLRLMNQIKPDLVIGDFRISLALSARLAKIPYVSLTHAYWSPDFALDYPVPTEMPFRFLVQGGAHTALWRFLVDLLSASVTREFSKVAAEMSVPQARGDLRHVFSVGDFVLYLDPLSWVPIKSPATVPAAFVGPLHWNAPGVLPSWWERLPDAAGSVIYVNLGSSGDHSLTQEMIRHLRKGRDPVVLVAPSLPEEQDGHFFTASFLPNQHILPRVKVMVCNGGTPATYRGLAEGCRIIGIPNNYDQQLNMRVLTHHRAAYLLEPSAALGDRLVRLIERASQDRELGERLQDYRRLFRPEGQRALLSELLSRI